MRVVEKGHTYELAHRGGTGTTRVEFVGREPGLQREGVLTQEVLRMLIDRTHYCNNCQPHPNNERIIYHLRMALVLHEARALERKVQKGELLPERTEIGEDGHYELFENIPAILGAETTQLDPYVPEWERPCNHTHVEPANAAKP